MSASPRPEGSSPTGSASPPAWARWLAARLVRGHNAEFVLADLADDYAQRRDARGALSSVLRFLALATRSTWIMRDRPLAPRRLLGGLGADTRFAIRSLRKNPGFAAVAVLTLALGIGANAAIFSVVHGVLLEPLPYPEPGELVNVWQIYYEWMESETAMFRGMAERFPISWPVYLEWTERSRSFEALTVYGNYPTIVDGIEIPEWVGVVSTTRSFVDVLGVQPVLGRWFSADEDRIGGERVVVLSHAYWQKLGGDASVLGTSLRLHGDPHTIIGVMPADFYFPDRAHDLWYPVPGGRRNDRFGSQSMSAVGRLAAGVTLEAAQREMEGIAEQIVADVPEAIDAGVRLVGRVDEVAGNTAGTLRLLAAAVGLVLVVAAANVAGLLLVRATERRQELAVRSALGARRGRLVAQLLVEGAILAAAGGAVALVAVSATFGWLRALLPADTPRLEDVAVTWEVGIFVAAVSALVAVVFGALAALHLRRDEPADGLRDSDRVTVGSSGRTALVIGEVAVGVVLLVAAALLAGSYFRLASLSSGIHTDGLLSLRVAAPIDLWHDQTEELQAFYDASMSRIATIPGITGSAAVSRLPFGGGRSSGGFGFVENAESRDDAGWSLEQNISPDYFEVMGIPILIGRTLRDDVRGPAEMVVNERFVERYYPDRSPLGETIWDNGAPHTIVGVAADVTHGRLDEEIEAKRYRPLGGDGAASFSVALRVNGDPAPVVAAAREALRSVDPATTVSEFALMTDLVARTTALPRFRTLLLTALAGLAMLLSVIGLYGIVAFAVASRRREFGLRLTLGAAGRDVARLVLRDGMRVIVPGILLGLAGSLAAGRWIAGYLYAIEPGDPATLAAVAAAVAGLSLLAMALPAWRAIRVDPIESLRSD